MLSKLSAGIWLAHFLGALEFRLETFILTPLCPYPLF